MRKISIERVQPGMITRRPVLGFLGQVLLSEGMIIKEKHLYYLKQMGITALYVHDERLSDVEVDDIISVEVRGESRALVAQVMKDLDAAGPGSKGLAIKDKEIIAMVTKIVDELMQSKEALIQLSDIRAHDGYVFAHSVNCCVISTLIAAKLNYDLKTLKLLATGALLHDIGLVAVPQIILKKPGALSDEEYEAVKRHPSYGYEILKKSKLFSERAGEIILQHHERYRGQGYPQGRIGKEIASLARIVAVADVFDAITSEKTYRHAYPVHEAFEMMMAWGGDLFDLDVLNTFLKHITAYPIGSHVLLDNGESGFVVGNSPGFALRPVVRLLFKKDLTPHPAPFDLDLKRVLNLNVVGLVDEKNVPTEQA